MHPAFQTVAASRRATKFWRVVPANNRAHGGRAGQNHLGIPFNRTASETNCGLTVCRLQPGQSEAEKGQSVGVKAAVGGHEGWIRVRDYDLSEIGG